MKNWQIPPELRPPHRGGEPDDPNPDPGDPNPDPGDPNPDPGDPNPDPGDPNPGHVAQKRSAADWKILVSLISTLFLSTSYGQDSSWICASQKADIPNKYFVVEIATDLSACTYPKQKVLISKIGAPNFWMCNFAYIGAPSGYVVAEESAVQTCGCKAPAKDGSGKVYCFGNEPEGKKGWPTILVHKLPSER